MSHPTSGSASDDESPPVCPRHPDRTSYVRCQRCERPMCPDCQRQAVVGSQCVDCVKTAQREARPIRGIFGGAAAHGRPFVTQTLIGICVVIYVAQLAAPRVTSSLAYAPFLTGQDPWRLLSAAFVHSPASAGNIFAVFHLVMNMVALLFCGQYLEPLLGRARFVALYLVSALGGSVGYELFAAFATDPASGDSLWFTGTVGASGAVFGLFGAILVLNRHLGRDMSSMLGLILINAAIPFFYPNIAWQAHVGGALTGAAVAGIIAALGRDRAKAQWPGVAALAVALAVGSWVTYEHVIGSLGL